MAKTRVFGKKKVVFTLHAEYEDMMDAYAEWKRLKMLKNPPLVRITPSRYQRCHPGVISKVWVAERQGV